VCVNQLDGLRRYLEAATTLTQITRGRAEELVRDLVASGELERTRAQEWIEDLVKRSRDASEMLVSSISAEVDRQLEHRGFKNLDLDDLAQKVAGLLEHAGSVGRNVTVPRAWSRDAGGTAATATAGAKTKSGSGKKKDGSTKSPPKEAKKGPDSKRTDSKKTDSKKSESKKTGSTTTGSTTTESQKTEPQKTESQKTESQKTGPAAGQPVTSQPVTSQPMASHTETVDEGTQPVDHGVAT